MSDQFSFEEEHPLDWLKETSQFTNNNLSLHSDLSKDHFLDDLLRPLQPQPVPHPTYTPNPHLRQRNKINSKNYRERKKGQLENIRREVQQLKKENQSLRNQKYCRWCRQPYSHPVLCPASTFTSPQFKNDQSFLPQEENFQMEAQFQKPELIIGKKVQRRGKIWMALGILMLVLGITLHGLEGDKKQVKQIQIYRQQMSRWSQQLQSKGEEYFEVKMRVKQQRKSMEKGDPGQLRIVYKSEVPRRSQYDEENVSINKQLLYGIHAELDDIGVYL